MRTKLALIIPALLIGVLASSTLAHHSVLAEFDSSKATSITGMVSKIEWSNPHVWIYLTVSNGNQSIPWRVQIASRGALEKSGIDKNTIDLAKPVTFEVWPALSEGAGYRHGNGRLLTLSDGRKFDVSDKWPEGKGPNNPR